jgi:hypothetical protein
MADQEHEWFAPARFFEHGYPAGITSALRQLDEIRSVVREEVVASGSRLTLEIGPGDAPVAQGIGRVVFLDVVSIFLAQLPGELRVRADLFAAPFAAGTFDLVVANDVLTHVLPEARPGALAAIAALARRVLLFNPEPGTGLVPRSPSPTEPIVEFFERAGWTTWVRTFLARTIEGGEYRMKLIKAMKS